MQDDKVLLVKEGVDKWWALPGGGVDYGETVASTLVREVEEELGVPAEDVSSDLQIVHYNIGNVVNGVPRMNLFFKASVPESSLRQTNDIAEWRWHTKDEFLKSDMHPSYDKAELATVIFGNR